MLELIIGLNAGLGAQRLAVFDLFGRAEIVSGGEDAIGASQHHDPDSFVFARQFESLLQFIEHLVALGVTTRGSVHSDFSDGAVGRIEDMLKIQGLAPSGFWRSSRPG